MKWSEAISNIDWSDESVAGWVDIEPISIALGMHVFGYFKEVDERMKQIWLKSWVCTDTMVGASAYFLDDELVAVSWQSARKSDQEIKFIDKQAALKVVNFLISLDDKTQHIEYADLNEEF